MECPCCGLLRHSKNWSKAQLTLRCPLVTGRFGCRVCTAGITVALEPDDVNYHDKMHALSVDLATHLDALGRFAAVHPTAASSWDVFMCSWKPGAPRPSSKDSYFGALPCTFPWEPSHCAGLISTAGIAPNGDAESAPPSHQMFYNAGNNVYAFAIQWLFPEAESTSRYSLEYLGDLAESILGPCCPPKSRQ